MHKPMDSEDDLQKGIKHAVAAVAAGAALSAAPVPVDHWPKSGTHEIEPNSPHPAYDRKQMLRTIASVESSGGKDTNHALLGGMHAGERAYGKYGLTPAVIRETIKMNHDLKQAHGKAAMLQGQDLHNYMKDNPGLEDSIADKHLARLEHHFGQDPAKLGYAWLNGVTGTYKAKKENKNLDDHWHVTKIKQAYTQNANRKPAGN